MTNELGRTWKDVNNWRKKMAKKNEYTCNVNKNYVHLKTTNGDEFSTSINGTLTEIKNHYIQIAPGINGNLHPIPMNTERYLSLSVYEKENDRLIAHFDFENGVKWGPCIL